MAIDTKRRIATELLVGLLLLGAVALYAAGLAEVWDFTADDAGISFCYARSLAEGEGLVLTPGSERSEGYSNLLWVILLSVAIGHGIPPALAAKCMSFLLGTACLWLVVRLPARVEDRPAVEPIDAVPAILLALATPFVFWTAGGLENTLFAFLLLAAFWSFCGETRRKEPFPVSALLLFAATLTRPEGPLHALFVLPALLACRPGHVRGWIEWIACFSLPLAGYAIWRHAYFGSWLSPVWSTKLGGGLADHATRLNGGLDYLASYLEAWPAYLAGLVLWGAVVWCRGRVGLWAVGSLAAGAVFPVLSGGDWMQHHRFLTAAIPFLMLLLGAGLRGLVCFLYSPDPVTPGRDVPTLAGCLAILLVLGRVGLPSWQETRNIDGRYRVTFESRLERGRHFRELARRVGLTAASLADPDVGGTAWAAGMPIVDLAGLTDRTLARHGLEPRVRDEYLFVQRRPTFLRLHGVWGEATGLAGSPWLESQYLLLPPIPGDLQEDRNYVHRDVLVAYPEEQPEFEMSSDFGGQLVLTGITKVTDTFAPGGALELLLYWERGKPQSGAYTVDVLLSSGSTRHTTEHVLALGWYPPALWKPAETIRERVEVRIPPGLAEGEYRIGLSVRDPAGQIVRAASGRMADVRVRVSKLEARRQAREMGEGMGVGGDGGREPRIATWHRVRRLECSGAVAEAELREYRKRAANAVLDLGHERLDDRSTGEAVAEAEASACYLQARAWNVRGDALRVRLTDRLLQRARVLASRGDWPGALRTLATLLRVDGSCVPALTLRDSLWPSFLAGD